MSDKMRSISFDDLLLRMMSEYSKSRSIFGISEINFFKPSCNKVSHIFGESCSMPLGPAAGPHTQLSQNIIASYLAGSRFLELKTVQLNVPHVGKPCIDARDECYNTEWSSEYEVEAALLEYTNAWIAIYFLEYLFDLGHKDLDKSFIFNMSVGYDMEGIKSSRVDNFINSMMDGNNNPLFKKNIEILESFIESSALSDTLKNNEIIKKRLSNIKGISKKISPNICSSLTLSTMHGCPPSEIEKIVSYMLTEKNINTYVKLNPTLLGYDKVRSILDSTGFDYVKLNKDSFTHDLCYSDAKKMLTRLIDLAHKNNRHFGVKLTNTLGNINPKDVLGGDEQYMSGRALYPLSITVADIISDDFDGKIPISYSGGLTIFNAKKIFESGIKPLTLATDLLKPGGYNRLGQLAKEIENSEAWALDKIDTESLHKLANNSTSEEYSKKSFRGFSEVSVPSKLPITDCAVAPCVVHCPIHQPIPEYIKLVGEGKYDEALNIITEKNMLPAITGYICDHKCQSKCSRLDYEGDIKIRDIKGIAVSRGKRSSYKTDKNNGVKVLVIGAGAAGLSVAGSLQRNGFSVTVREREASPAGIVRHIIPKFRIPSEIIDSDIESIKDLGVVFEFNSNVSKSVETLKKEGYKYVCVATGAYEVNTLKLEGENKNVIDAFKFLYQFNKNRDAIDLGESVAVIGAGNTAMDTARAAKKIKNVKEVSIIYRRSEHEMPSDDEEIKLAKSDGIKFYLLSNPSKYDNDGTLTCEEMKLGDMDSSGRRSPVSTGNTFTIKVDSVIPALGYYANTNFFNDIGLKTENDNVYFNKDTGESSVENVFVVGDAKTGASSIVKCIADGLSVSLAIQKKENKNFNGEEFKVSESENIENVISKNNDARNNVYTDSNKDLEKQEYTRCLNCDKICNKCVDVCPNRANVALPILGFNNYYQIVHIDGYCNECANCSTFCPWNGKPYKDKITVFSSKEDLLDSENQGFYFDNKKIHIRFMDSVGEYDYSLNAIINLGESENAKNFSKIISSIINDYSYLI